jgi:uncharacterized membrane protein YecN with MAPEG domain
MNFLIAVPVTLLYGGLTALLLTVLGLAVSLGRLTAGKGIGAALEGDLVRRVRAHGNAAEWAPLGLLLLLVLELSGLGRQPLHLLGGVLFAGRVVHALGVYRRVSALVTGGAAITYTVTGSMACGALARHFQG